MKMWQIYSIYLITIIFKEFQNTFAQDLPCHFHESVNITDGLRHSNGSITHDGFLYHSGSYGYTDEIYNDSTIKQSVQNHLRGCICSLRSSKPCVPFCCQSGFKRNSEIFKCEPDDQKVILNSSNTEPYEIFDVAKKFRMILGGDCMMFVLDQNITWTL